MPLSELMLLAGKTLRSAERHILTALFGRPPPPPCLELACDLRDDPIETSPADDGNAWDGFLFAVPKHRRTIEKRLNRKFGWPHYHYKILLPKKNIKVCNECGHNHEIGALCGNCYERIRQETKLMQDKIKEELGLNPIEQDVVVLYENEKMEQPEEFWKGKRIVEMEKPRPPWFSKNLLQKSTQQPATSTDVKPTELA